MYLSFFFPSFSLFKRCVKYFKTFFSTKRSMHCKLRLQQKLVATVCRIAFYPVMLDSLANRVSTSIASRTQLQTSSHEEKQKLFFFLLTFSDAHHQNILHPLFHLESWSVSSVDVLAAVTGVQALKRAIPISFVFGAAIEAFMIKVEVSEKSAVIHTSHLCMRA